MELDGARSLRGVQWSLRTAPVARFPVPKSTPNNTVKDFTLSHRNNLHTPPPPFLKSHTIHNACLGGEGRVKSKAAEIGPDVTVEFNLQVVDLGGGFAHCHQII